MRSSVLKMTCRTIRSFKGRYLALLLIVALSVGFFAGLKVSQDAMTATCDDYLSEQNFYDYRLISAAGFTEEDVQALSELSFIEDAEGMRSVDALVSGQDLEEPFVLLSLPDEISLPSLTAGRMPEAADECLADARAFDEEDIGSTIRISDENSPDTLAQLSGMEFTITGLADSPLYLSTERGTTSLGGGSLSGFLYLPEENFTAEIYTEISLTLEEKAPAYSGEYEALIGRYEEEILAECEDRTARRFSQTDAAAGTAPEIYLLTRSENAGYVSFENDTSIVSGVADIFPVFFILIAILVCITTMTRMVDEERTQIGVLKAMGYSRAAVTAKYLLYAGSATLIGWAAGFFPGTWGLPQVFWYAYSLLYGFTSLKYLFSPSLAVLTLAVSLTGILGSTWLSCRRELAEQPAQLIRPRSAKDGKRILLERIAPLWKRLSFLQKVTLRNMFRYKKRLFMMLIGIGCCAGLIVTAFGVRDSMIHVGSLQYGDIQKYDIEASVSGDAQEETATELRDVEGVGNILACSSERADLYSEADSEPEGGSVSAEEGGESSGQNSMNSVSLYGFEDSERFQEFWDLHGDNGSVPFPEAGQAAVNQKIAERLSLSVGDTFEIRLTDGTTSEVTVGGIFDSYIGNFVILSAETYEEAFGGWQADTLLISAEDAAGGGDADIVSLSEAVTSLEGVTGVTRLSDTQESVDSALSCLNYIIWLILLFSGALAFIVIFNLTNINLAERSREIATVEVLGFYPEETESYVLRENLVLSVIAGLIGLPLGTLFHRIVMAQIDIENMSFDIHITAASYVLALICTVLFAVIINLFMRRQIGKIQMTESLKAVE